MAVELFSWPSLHERMCRAWGSNSGLLACQANSLPIKLPRPVIILGQNMCCSRYFDYLKCEKMLIFSLARFARSKVWKLVNFRIFCAKKLFKDFICFSCRIREVHFSELVKGICHLSAARRQIGRKTAVFWSVKNWIWSGKSQWKVGEFCFCMRVATLKVSYRPR